MRGAPFWTSQEAHVCRRASVLQGVQGHAGFPHGQEAHSPSIGGRHLDLARHVLAIKKAVRLGDGSVLRPDVDQSDGFASLLLLSLL